MPATELHIPTRPPGAPSVDELPSRPDGSRLFRLWKSCGAAFSVLPRKQLNWIGIIRKSE